MAIIVLGQDIGDSTGWAVSVDGKIKEFGIWKLKADKLGPNRDQQLGILHSKLEELKKSLGPNDRLYVAVEDITFAKFRLAYAANVGRRAIMELACFRANIPLILVHSGTLKKTATGNGKAKKPEMISTAIKKFNIELPDTAASEDVADACWISYSGYLRVEEGKEVEKIKRNSSKFVSKRKS